MRLWKITSCSTLLRDFIINRCGIIFQDNCKAFHFMILKNVCLPGINPTWSWYIFCIWLLIILVHLYLYFWEIGNLSHLFFSHFVIWIIQPHKYLGISAFFARFCNSLCGIGLTIIQRSASIYIQNYLCMYYMYVGRGGCIILT